MTNDLQPTWTKQLDKFTLLEYPKQPHHLGCCVQYEDGLYYFAFGGWGMEREEITAQDCFLVCQEMLNDDCNVSFMPFKAHLDYCAQGLEDD